MAPENAAPSVAEQLYDAGANDPNGEIIDRTGLSEQDLAEINRIMAALGRLRKAEEGLAEASMEYMQLGRTDMRALQMLIIAEHTGVVTTPGLIAERLGISTASTTKLLDRLERGGHIRRKPHPSDRRALQIIVTPSTKQAAMQTMGMHQGRRFAAAAKLTSAEREVVSRFIHDMADGLDVTGADWAQRT